MGEELEIAGCSSPLSWFLIANERKRGEEEKEEERREKEKRRSKGLKKN